MITFEKVDVTKEVTEEEREATKWWYDIPDTPENLAIKADIIRRSVRAGRRVRIYN